MYFGLTESLTISDHLSTKYRTAGLDKRIRDTSLDQHRQCSIVGLLTCISRSNRIDYTVVWFMKNDCSRKLRKQY